MSHTRLVTNQYGSDHEVSRSGEWFFIYTGETNIKYSAADLFEALQALWPERFVPSSEPTERVIGEYTLRDGQHFTITSKSDQPVVITLPSAETIIAEREGWDKPAGCQCSWYQGCRNIMCQTCARLAFLWPDTEAPQPSQLDRIEALLEKLWSVR